MANQTLTRRSESPTDLFEVLSPINLLRNFSAELMPIEECREGDQYFVRAELPGMDPKNIDVNCHDGALTITAHRQEHGFDGHDGILRSEFRYGSLARNCSLPRDVQVDQCKATYRDGILELRMPCTHQSESKKVKIQT